MMYVVAEKTKPCSNYCQYDNVGIFLPLNQLQTKQPRSSFCYFYNYYVQVAVNGKLTKTYLPFIANKHSCSDEM